MLRLEARLGLGMSRAFAKSNSGPDSYTAISFFSQIEIPMILGY
jgi:hypothetical protein